jgi:hypothetical protein
MEFDFNLIHKHHNRTHKNTILGDDNLQQAKMMCQLSEVSPRWRVVCKSYPAVTGDDSH